MIRELSGLREDAAGLAQKLARARYRRAAGLPAEAPLREMLAAHRLAASKEGLAQAREALADAEEEDPKRPGRIARLASLRDFLLRARATALEPGAVQELWDLPARPLVRPPGDAGLHGALPPVAVERELPLIRSRERRSEMESALATALQPADSVRSAAWDAALEALDDLGPYALHARGWAPPAAPETKVNDVHMREREVNDVHMREQEVNDVHIADEEVNAVHLAAERLLEGTDALAADLGGWLLERHTGAKRGSAERHDILHLLHAPHCASAFPAGEMMRTVRRWTAMLRLDLDAKLDDDDRPLKAPGAWAELLDPPEVGITNSAQMGPRPLASLLGAISVAQLRAGPPGDAPPEDLWFSDPAVPWACRALLEGLIREAEFLRRCARVELPPDDQRAIAIAAVFDARHAAARTLSSLQAHELGLGERAEQFHRDAFSRAMGADLPAGLALRELDPWLAPFAELRGRAFAARARAFLRDRFDEDWWRNPRALPSLAGLWSRGGRPTLAELWAELGGALSVDPLLEELAEACR